VTATQTATSAPAWRFAVIGIVTALAVGIGVVVGALILDSRTSAIGSGATYVPATAPLYVEVRLQPSEGQDAALREFLDRFPPIEGVDLDEPLYGQLTAMLDDALAESGTTLSWSADVEPWFDGRVGFALFEFPDPTAVPVEPDAEVLGTSSGVVLIGVSDRATAQSSIDRIIAESDAPMTFSPQEHGGVTIQVDDESGLAYALTDDQLLLAPTADDIVAALDAHAAGDTALSDAGSISAFTEALPDEWLVFGIYDFTDALASALEGSAGASPGAEAMRDLMEGQPLRGAMALTVEGDRVSVPVVSDPPGGSFAVTNADRGLADEVPGDALYYAEGGNVGDALSGLIGTLKESAAAMPDGAAQLDMIDAALGGDLEEQVAWIGDAATAVGYDGEQPWGGVVIAPTDMEQARRTIDRLSSFAGLATLDPSIGITVEEREVDGVDVTTLTWQDPSAQTEPPADEMPFAPTALVAEWAVTDDRVLIGVGDRFVERVIGLDRGDSLAQEPRYADAVADLGGASNAGVTWVDLRGVRVALEGVIGEFDPASLESYEADILPWLEPLDRLVTIARVDGDLMRSESVLLVE
jgi:uncharacterized protein DUF3352